MPRTAPSRHPNVKHRLYVVTGAIAGIAAVVLAGCAGPAVTKTEGGGSFMGSSIRLVTDGQTEAVIAVSADADELVAAFAELLSEYVRRSTGAVIPVEKGPLSTDRLRIHVGVSDYVQSLDLGVDAMDEGAFVIAFPDNNNMVLVGGSKYGTEHAVFEFLERYVGVRWLYPGDQGEHVPTADTIIIPRHEVRQTPAFLSRALSLGGSPSTALKVWTRCNRIRGRTSFHHNLCNLFPPAEYAESHPNFFPVRKGVPNSWNPDLLAEGLLEEAIKRISEYFEKYPHVNSYSLGMNDAAGFPAPPSTKKNSLGMDDQSDYFYAWANKVAKAVCDKYPRATLGCLAYQSVTDPPSFKVHPRVIPYICYDRMQWIDSARRETDKARTKAWHEACPTLGWYDYIYGRQYCLPRIYFHLMGEYFAFANQNGVKDYYGEAYPSSLMTEGPKLYLVAKLLWNPDIDVDQTLKDWYRCAVGDDAAPYLEAYFAHWEEFWTKRVPETSWFKSSPKRIWLPFGLASYADALTADDLIRCQQLLDEVAARSVTPIQKARANAFMHAFNSLKSGGLIGHIDFMAMNQTPQAPDGDLVFKDSFDSGKAPTETTGPARADWVSGLPAGWSNWQRSRCTATFGWDQNVGHETPGALVVDAKGALYGPVVFIKTVPHSSQVGSAEEEAVTRLEPLKKGRIYRVECWARSEGLAEGAVIELVLKWFDRNGAWLGKEYRRAMPLEQIVEGQWQKLSAYFSLPENAVTFICMPSVGKTDQGKVWFDDVALYGTRSPE